MRSKGKMVGWGVALAAAVALIITGTMYAASGPAGATKRSLSMDEMRSVLVPLSSQPPSQFMQGPMTLQEAAAQFPEQPGIVFSPRSCLSYFEDVVGPFTSLNGWLQFGSRVHADGDPSAAHNDTFFQWVVKIPGGANVGAIAAAVSTCRTGTVTVEGTVTGDVTYTERQAPQFPGAQSYAVTNRVQFHEAPGTEGAAIVARYAGSSAQSISLDQQSCQTENVFVGSGDILIIVQEADAAFADGIAGAMLQNVNWQRMRPTPWSPSSTPLALGS